MAGFRWTCIRRHKSAAHRNVSHFDVTAWKHYLFFNISCWKHRGCDGRAVFLLLQLLVRLQCWRRHVRTAAALRNTQRSDGCFDWLLCRLAQGHARVLMIYLWCWGSSWDFRNLLIFTDFLYEPNSSRSKYFFLSFMCRIPQILLFTQN